MYVLFVFSLTLIVVNAIKKKLHFKFLEENY